jgi:hypothetical protein
MQGTSTQHAVTLLRGRLGREGLPWGHGNSLDADFGPNDLTIKPKSGGASVDIGIGYPGREGVHTMTTFVWFMTFFAGLVLGYVGGFLVGRKGRSLLARKQRLLLGLPFLLFLGPLSGQWLAQHLMFLDYRGVTEANCRSIREGMTKKEVDELLLVHPENRGIRWMYTPGTDDQGDKRALEVLGYIPRKYREWDEVHYIDDQRVAEITVFYGGRGDNLVVIGKPQWNPGLAANLKR